MRVNEIFLSIQGEGIYSGLPTIFVRFTGCNLRCSYCDTTYAYDEGNEISPNDIYSEIIKYYPKRVCLTGGEPLLQNDINELLDLLHDYNVTIETNGSIPLDRIAIGSNHSFVMDMKVPGSGCSDKMIFDNFQLLRECDQIKFVIGNKADYEWALNIITQNYNKGIILFSPIFDKINYEDLVSWILADKVDVRFQLQLHKIIWDANKRGV